MRTLPGSSGVWIAATQQLALISPPSLWAGSLSGGTIGTFQNYDYNLNPGPVAPPVAVGGRNTSGHRWRPGAQHVGIWPGRGAVHVPRRRRVDRPHPLRADLGEWPFPGQVDKCPSSNGYISAKHISIPGLPFRIWALPNGDFAILSGTGTGPVITTVDGSLHLVQSQANSGPWFGPPEIPTEPLGAIVQGGNVTLSVTAIGSNLSYTWYNQNYQAVGTGSSLTLSNIGSSQAGAYSVTVNGDGQDRVLRSESRHIVIPHSPDIRGLLPSRRPCRSARRSRLSQAR